MKSSRRCANMTTHPNQKIIKIYKPKPIHGFLQVNKEDWQEAYKTLGQSAFGLYLYLANNNDDFRIALSPIAVKNAIGISESTYRRAIDELIKWAYLTLEKNNTYVFTTAPNEDSEYYL